MEELNKASIYSKMTIIGLNDVTFKNFFRALKMKRTNDIVATLHIVDGMSSNLDNMANFMLTFPCQTTIEEKDKPSLVCVSPKSVFPKLSL